MLVRWALIIFMIGICFEASFAGEVRQIRKEDFRIGASKPVDSGIHVQRPVLSVGPNDLDQGENKALSLENSGESDESDE
ncbi:MAG: hypothetical protein IPJ71_14215 [Bdellovibrionales bacterium]|nr:hypothetical protein [Bdellovibrionales bacterium]